MRDRETKIEIERERGRENESANSAPHVPDHMCIYIHDRERD